MLCESEQWNDVGTSLSIQRFVFVTNYTERWKNIVNLTVEVDEPYSFSYEVTWGVRPFADELMSTIVYLPVQIIEMPGWLHLFCSAMWD